MVTSGRQKSKARRPPSRTTAARAAPPKKAARPPPPKSKPLPKKSAAPAAKPAAVSAPKSPARPKEPEAELQVPLPGGRRHVLSLSFVRDGDEFLARLETDSGHITEFKNRSLDQLLTLVAGELEDLVE